MDKKIFLLDKSVYKKRPSVTEKDLEKWVAEEDYENDYSIIKIDANNMCQTITETIDSAIVCDVDEYFIFLFGYDFKEELEKYSLDFLKDFIDKNIEDKKIENMKDLDKKSEGELLNVITNTLNKINKINEKSNIAGLYFQTMNKMIDFKMVENEQKIMREAYNKKGELKSTRNNASKAKKVIEKAESDLKDSEI